MNSSCSDESSKQEYEPANGDSVIVNSSTARKGLDVEPRLKQADSLQILYFDDPDGDSSRYTRYYRYISSRDSYHIGQILADLSQPFEQRNDIKNCRSEGKIYMYGGKEPLKTIYFSTRCDSCCYLYFIKDGNFLYFPLSDKMNSLLKESKRGSQRP